MRQTISAKEVVRQAPDVRVVLRQIIGALLDDRNEPGLIRQPSRKIDADIRHLARGRDSTLIARTIVGALLSSGTGSLLGTGQGPRPAYVGFSGHPDSGKIGFPIRQPRRR